MQAKAVSGIEAELAEEHCQSSQRQSGALETSKPQQEQGGTTALVACVVGDKLHVANVGDCRAVLCRRDASGSATAIALSTDHTPESEVERINAAGFQVWFQMPIPQAWTADY